MYTLRFPAHLTPKLAEVFEQHKVADQVSKVGNEIVLTLEEQDYVSLHLDLHGSRLGPKGGWPPLLDSSQEGQDPDRPQTEPPPGLDFR